MAGPFTIGSRVLLRCLSTGGVSRNKYIFIFGCFCFLVDEPVYVCSSALPNLEFLVLNGSYFERALGYLSSLIYAHIKLEFKCYVLTD